MMATTPGMVELVQEIVILSLEEASEEVFGAEIQDTYEKTTKPDQFQTVSTSYRDGIRQFQSKDLKITDYDLKNRWTVVSKNYYDLTQVDKTNVALEYVKASKMTSTDDFAITKNVESVRVAEYRSVAEDVCIKCGDCNDVCPVGILPQNIMDAELRSVNDRIVELNTAECVECGLCTYVCPSKINVLEWVRRARRRVG